jgi:hypothetical protein
LLETIAIVIRKNQFEVREGGDEIGGERTVICADHQQEEQPVFVALLDGSPYGRADFLT